MRNNIDYVGTTARKRRESNLHTVRKSRRLAMKRRRERRVSVADALGLTPTRNASDGNDLRKMAAEQLAVAAATNDRRQTDKANRRSRKTRARGDDHEPLLEYTRSLFNSPVVARGRDRETTEESDPFEEPNTDDRRFIKANDESKSEGEYVPTDPEEFSSGRDSTPRRRDNRAARYALFHSLETKNEDGNYRGEDTKVEYAEAPEGAQEDERLREGSSLFSPPTNHRKRTGTAAPMQRQNTPQYSYDSDLQLQHDRASVNLSDTPRPNGRQDRMHTQEVRMTGEVDTFDPVVSPEKYLGKGHVRGGRGG